MASSDQTTSNCDMTLAADSSIDSRDEEFFSYNNDVGGDDDERDV